MAKKTLDAKSTRDLWLEALTSLQDKERAIFERNLKPGESENISLSALHLAEAAKRDSEQNPLSFSFRGKKHYVRDVLGRIVGWMKKFQEVAEFIVGLDVSGHAALPWSVIKFCLDVAGKDFEKHGAMLEGLEFASREIQFYTIFEAHYLNQSSETASQLAEALVEAYAKLLGSLAQEVRYYQDSALTTFDDDGVDKMISEVEKARPRIQQYAGLIDAERLKEGLGDLGKDQNAIKERLAEWQIPFERMSSQMSHLEDSVNTAEKKEILDWVSTIDNDGHYQEAKRDRLEGSGDWLLDHGNLIQWKNSPKSSLLWLHGIPGSGKTKLSSLIVDTLNDHITPLAYFFCARNTAEPERAQSAQILRCILRQLAYRGHHSTIRKELSSKYDQLTDGGIQKNQLSLEDSTALIVEIAQNYPDITIVIDALDECEDYHTLLEKLELIIKKSNCPIRVFVTSRNEQDISILVKRMPSTDIEIGQNLADIDRYIRVEIDRAISKKALLPHGISPYAKQKIIEALVKGADGMFRWVALQLQSLCMMKTEKSVLDELSHLPKELADIYDEIFKKMMHDMSSFEIATKALKLLACSQMPLPTNDFLVATSQPDMISSSELLDYCCNLIIEDKNLGIFRFAHLTVREFLERRDGFQERDLNGLAAEICLQKVAKMGRIRKLPDSQQPQDNLLNYSILFWPVHSQLSGELRTQAPLAPLFSTLFEQRRAVNSFSKWMEAARKAVEELNEESEVREKLRYSFCSPAHPFFLACVFGLTEVVEKSNVPVTQKCELGLTGLHLASKYGNLEVVNILLARGASNQLRDTYGRTSLFHAVGKGHLKIVEAIMAHETDFENPDVIARQLILLLSQNETAGTEMGKLLISRNSNLRTNELMRRAAAMASTMDLADSIRNEAGCFDSPQQFLNLAAYENNRDLLECLIEEEDSDELTVDAETLDYLFRAYQPGKKAFEPLFPAIKNSTIPDEELLRLFSRGGLEPLAFLLDSGKVTTISQDAFKSAAKHPRDGLEMLKLLRTRKADLVVDTNIMITAADNRDSVQALALVEYLLHLNPGVCVTQNVLERAVCHGHGILIQYLLERFDSILVTDDLIKTANTSRRGTTILELLLTARPDFKIDKSFLCKTVKYADQKFLKFLFARAPGIEVDEAVVLSAVKSNKPSAVRFLLSHASELCISSKIIEDTINCYDLNYKVDLDVDQKLDDELNYELSFGESQSAVVLDMLSLVLTRTVEFKPTESILVIAAKSDNARECLGYLIARYGSIPVTDAVWSAAAFNTYQGAIEVLLGQEIRPTDMEAILLEVAGRGSSETMDLLLRDAGDSVDHKKWSDIASLTSAVLNCDSKKVRDLLASGVPPIAEYKYPEFGTKSSYLHLASASGSDEIVKAMLDTGKFDIEMRDYGGYTALMRAAALGNSATVRLLLECGANLEAELQDGETALSLAKDSEYPIVVDVLTDWKLKNDTNGTKEGIVVSHTSTRVDKALSS